MNLLTTIVLMAAAGLSVQDGMYTDQATPVAQQPVVQAPLDYTTAYQNAMAGDKPLLILVTADWCPPCQVMKSTTIPELELNRDFDGFHFAKLDIDQEREVGMQLIGERGLPQLIMFEKEDERWTRRYLRGIQTADNVRAFIAQANAIRTAEMPDHVADK